MSKLDELMRAIRAEAKKDGTEAELAALQAWYRSLRR